YETEEFSSGIDVRKNPVHEIRAPALLGAAGQTQLLAPAFPEDGNAGLARILGAVACNSTSDDQINPSVEYLFGNILENLIVPGIKAHRAADHGPACLRLQCAHAADGTIAERLRAGLSEKRAFQGAAGLPRRR